MLLFRLNCFEDKNFFCVLRCKSCKRGDHYLWFMFIVRRNQHSIEWKKVFCKAKKARELRMHNNVETNIWASCLWQTVNGGLKLLFFICDFNLHIKQPYSVTWRYEHIKLKIQHRRCWKVQIPLDETYLVTYTTWHFFTSKYFLLLFWIFKWALKCTYRKIRYKFPFRSTKKKKSCWNISFPFMLCNDEKIDSFHIKEISTIVLSCSIIGLTTNYSCCCK